MRIENIIAANADTKDLLFRFSENINLLSGSKKTNTIKIYQTKFRSEKVRFRDTIIPQKILMDELTR
jgi:hypothetical protein